MELKEGLTATSITTVDHTNTAQTLGSGDLAVLATPAMIALMENAAMKAVAPALAEGSTTVGIAINSTHVKASGLGQTITATATVTTVEDRKITLTIEASDNDGLIGQATHSRFIVDRIKFMSRVK